MRTFPRAIRPVRRLVRREGQRLQAQPHRPMDLAVKGGHGGRRMLQNNRHRAPPKLYQAHRRPSPGSLISRSPGIRWSDRSPPPSVVGCREVSPRPPVRASAPPDLLAGGQGQGRPRSPLRTAARRRLFPCGDEVFLHVHCPQDTTEAGKRHHCASCGRPRAGSPPKDGRPARDRVPS